MRFTFTRRTPIEDELDGNEWFGARISHITLLIWISGVLAVHFKQ